MLDKKSSKRTYNAVEVCEKVAEGASPSHTCYLSRNTMRKEMSNLYQAEDLIPQRWTSFSIFQEMILSSAFKLKIYNVILDQKRLRHWLSSYFWCKECKAS